jgi:NAD(P)-dependent dehydrogenase (short-subunit alcohol dehydrogenase family)
MMPISRRAVLTGAASAGYGVAILRRLHDDGYEVVGTYEPDDAESATRLGNELPNATLIEVDHSNRASLDALIGRVSVLGDIHALVNAQMYFAMEDPTKPDFSVWDRSLAVNLTAPHYLFYGLLDRFAANASIVTVTSTEGFVGSFGAPAYAATKAAIHNLTMSHANLSGSRGVRVNAVAAGWVGGVMDTDAVFDMSRAITPLGRLGSPDEIAGVVAFLLSEDAGFVNGTVVKADGGYLGVDTIAKYEFEAEQDQAST